MMKHVYPSVTQIVIDHTHLYKLLLVHIHVYPSITQIVISLHISVYIRPNNLLGLSLF